MYYAFLSFVSSERCSQEGQGKEVIACICTYWHRVCIIIAWKVLMNLLTASRHSDRYIYNVRGISFELSFLKDSIIFRGRVGTDPENWLQGPSFLGSQYSWVNSITLLNVWLLSYNLFRLQSIYVPYHYLLHSFAKYLLFSTLHVVFMCQAYTFLTVFIAILLKILIRSLPLFVALLSKLPTFLSIFCLC